MPFVPSESKYGLMGEFILFTVLLFFFMTVIMGIAQYPLTVKGLLLNVGQSYFSVPIAIVHGYMSIFTDFMNYIYTQIRDIIITPLQNTASGIQSTLNQAGSGLSSVLSGVGSGLSNL